MLDKLVHMVQFWWRRPHWFAELWSSVVLVGFAGWSLVQPISSDAFKSFDAIVRVMPAECWSYATGLTGIIQFGALWADRRALRGIAALCSTWLFSALTIGAVMAFPSPIDVFPIGFLGINLFALLRAAGNAR